MVSVVLINLYVFIKTLKIYDTDFSQLVNVQRTHKFKIGKLLHIE